MGTRPIQCCLNMTAERQHVVELAKSYLNTKFHMGAALRGVGVDCGTYLVLVYGEAGFAVPKLEDLGLFTRDWHLHTHEQRYLNFITPFTRVVEMPEPGDVVLFSVEGVWAHSAIIIDPPLCIDARWNRGVQYSCWNQGVLSNLNRLYLSPFGN